MDAPDVAEFWEEHYRQRERVWSGRANPVLVEVAQALPPGTALDLGCGEGGDAVWLAQQGWRVTAVDVSATALARAAAHATAGGVAERVTLERHDLARSFPEGRFDLVTAQYLHSPVELPREQVLRRAAAAVAPDGLLLVVGHAAPPPWARHPHPVPDFPPPEAVLAALDLPPEEWRVERLESREREATGPDGQRGTLTDAVVAVRRSPPAAGRARTATVADAPVVARLLDDFNREFATPTPGVEVLTRRLERLLAGGDTVALLAGDPAVGVALLTLRPNVWYEGPVALLDELYVVPASRGQRLGTGLLRAAERATRQRGGTLLEVNVDGDDVDARRFYERHGYRNSEAGSEEQLLYYFRELPD